MRHAVRVVVAAALVVLLPAAAAAKWTRLSTASFVFLGDASAGQIRQVEILGRVLKLAAKQLSEVDFISYRSDTPGALNCGPLATPLRVLITYRTRPATTPAGMIDGDAVAIELVPEDYTP